MGGDFDGLWLHNQITNQWKGGETWRSQHTHELEGEKKKNNIFLFKVHSVSLKKWIFFTGTSELKRKKEFTVFWKEEATFTESSGEEPL